MALAAFQLKATSSGVFSIEDRGLSTGARWFVSSVLGTDRNDYGTDPTTPVATLAFAIGLAAASVGDIIYVMPGHVESLTTAGAITASKAGVSIIGLGQGSNRPTFTLANVAATIAVTAANVTFRNILLKASVDEVVSAFVPTAAFLTLDGVDFAETASCQLIQFLLGAATATDLTIRNCRHYQAAAAAAAQVWFNLLGCDRCLIENNITHLTLSNNAGSFTLGTAGTAPTNVTIRNNLFVQLGGTTQTKVISLPTSSSGYVADNRVAANVTTLAGTIALPSTVYAANNLVSHTGNKSGILDPVVDS